MTERGAIEVFADAPAVAAALAGAFVELGRGAIVEHGAFAVALSGGTTPRAAYELLATPAYRSRLDWTKVHVYFGDERCVPPTDPASNYGMAAAAFLDAVAIPKENVFRMRGEIEPAQAANEYATILRTAYGDPPRLDLVLLGLGENGHTASLFPGTPPERDDDSLVRAIQVPQAAIWRITVTPRVINNAACVIFAVEGAAKATVLARVIAGPRDTLTYPAQVVAPDSGRLTWLVDEAAAAQLVV